MITNVNNSRVGRAKRRGAILEQSKSDTARSPPASIQGLLTICPAAILLKVEVIA